MLTPNHVRAAIYNQLLTPVNASALEYEVIEDADGTTATKKIERDQVVFDNVKFEDSNPPEGKPWVRLAVRHLSRNQETLGKKGNRKFRVEALVMIQVFTLAETNTMEGDAVAWAVAELYDAEKIIAYDQYREKSSQVAIVNGDIVFGSASCSETGVEGKLWALLVEIPFSYETIK